jgi:ATP-dependent DNA helicase RecG
MIEEARVDATTIIELDISQYPLLAAELAQIQADAAAEYIDKA